MTQSNSFIGGFFMSNDIGDLIQEAMHQLKAFGLSEGTLKSYGTRAFDPIMKFYTDRCSTKFHKTLMEELKVDYQQQYKDGIISHNTLNWRLRGVNILLEIQETGFFEWKVFSHKKYTVFTDFFEKVISDFTSGLECSEKRKQNYKSIVQHFITHMVDRKMQDFSGIDSTLIRDFIMDISNDRPKSMDDVITGLKKFFKYLNEQEYINTTFWTILAAPRSRDHKVKPCMKLDETIKLIEQINKDSNVGKRDFAILTLAATTGLRAGDIASLKLIDINWKYCELHLTQGKTRNLLVLPLQKSVLTAIADYILHGRPKSESEYIFLRSYAPYTRFHDGVSISCIFRRYLLAAGIQHSINDGKTLHGIRRMLGTSMVTAGIPIPTIAQVLGHQGIKATKQYISFDIKGLQNCLLSMDSIGGICK